MSNLNGQGPKVLVRPHGDRWIAGVCAGLGRYFGLDVTLVRLIVALVTLFTIGGGALAYMIAWAVIPEEGQKTSIAEDFIGKNRTK